MTRAGFDSALREHREALEAFLDRARQVPGPAWYGQPSAGKWSPAEITEHLRLSLERFDGDLRGGPGMRAVLPAWKRFLLRHLALPIILRRRRFPKGAKAPREVRPTAAGASPEEAMSGLAAVFERVVSASTSVAARRRVMHPYFGGLTLPQMNRLLALHTRHHGEQLPDRIEGS